jgi:hypothetical protein
VPVNRFDSSARYKGRPKALALASRVRLAGMGAGSQSGFGAAFGLRSRRAERRAVWRRFPARGPRACGEPPGFRGRRRPLGCSLGGASRSFVLLLITQTRKITTQSNAIGKRIIVGDAYSGWRCSSSSNKACGEGQLDNG